MSPTDYGTHYMIALAVIQPYKILKSTLVMNTQLVIPSSIILQFIEPFNNFSLV